MHTYLYLYLYNFYFSSLSAHTYTHRSFLTLIHTKRNKGRRRDLEVTWSQGFQAHPATDYVWPWVSLSGK